MSIIMKPQRVSQLYLKITNSKAIYIMNIGEWIFSGEELIEIYLKNRIPMQCAAENKDTKIPLPLSHQTLI